jgi:hypothetical protein
MGGLSGTLTSLTQLHVPELEYLYKVSIGTPCRPTGRWQGSSAKFCMLSFHEKLTLINR